MNESAVSNTGPLLHPAEIGQEGQLVIFGLTTISDQVKGELRRRDVFDRIAATLGDHLMVEGVTQPELDAQRVALTGFKVQRTDVSVAALAARLSPDVMLTDDLELRKGLKAQGYVLVGSVGVLVRSLKTGRVTKAELQGYLEQLFDGSTLYLSKGFGAHVRKRLDSLPE